MTLSRGVTNRWTASNGPSATAVTTAATCVSTRKPATGRALSAVLVALAARSRSGGTTTQIRSGTSRMELRLSENSMTKPTICDRCNVRIDTGWNEVFKVKNATGVGGPSRIDLCVDCHADIKDELYDLLLGDGEAYEHPEEL